MPDADGFSSLVVRATRMTYRARVRFTLDPALSNDDYATLAYLAATKALRAVGHDIRALAMDGESVSRGRTRVTVRLEMSVKPRTVRSRPARHA